MIFERGEVGLFAYVYVRGLVGIPRGKNYALEVKSPHIGGVARGRACLDGFYRIHSVIAPA